MRRPTPPERNMLHAHTRTVCAGNPVRVKRSSRPSCKGLNGQKVWRRERTVRAFEAMPWLAAHSCCVYRYAVRFESLSPELLRPTRLY